MIKSLTDIRDKLLELWNKMEFHQRITLAALSLIAMAPFFYLTFGRTEFGAEPLQFGAAFDREGLMRAEQTLVDRGFTDFKTVGQRILAPKNKVEEYNAALFSSGAGSPQAPNEWEKAFEKVNVFTPRDQIEELREIHLRKSIRRLLQANQGVQEADVVWARSKTRTRWPQPAPVTATVMVTLKSGRELNNSVAESLRLAVVGMVPDLRRESVTVIDQSTGRAYTPSNGNDPFDSKVREYKEGVIQDFQSRINGALSYIPGVVVSVNVDFDNLRSSRERKQQIDPKAVELSTVVKTRSSTNVEQSAGGVPGTSSNQPRDLSAQGAPGKQSTEKDSETTSQSAASVTVTENEYIAAAPKAVRVAVSVPDDYFEKIALREGVKVGESDQEKADFRKGVDVIRTREQDKVKRAVATLLPTASPPEAVTVTSHTTIPIDMPKTDVPMSDTVMRFLMEWGGSLALGGLALFALLMLKKSSPVATPLPGATLEALLKSMQPEPPPAPVAVAAEAVPEAPPVPQTTRDFLQVAIEQDPAAAAAILQKWLGKAA